MPSNHECAWDNMKKRIIKTHSSKPLAKNASGGRNRRKRVLIDVELTNDDDFAASFSGNNKFFAKMTADGLLLKPADPQPSKIYVEPTTFCNLKCRSCMRNSWSEQEGRMTRETFGRIIRQTKKNPSIREMAFWGFGEPLTHPDIIDMVGQAGKTGVSTEIITNAALLDKEKSSGLIKAGLGKLVVSIDGVSQDKHDHMRPGANLAAIMDNISNLNALKILQGNKNPEIGIEFVLTRSNLSELPGLPDIAKKLSADFIIVSNILPYTPDMKDEILYGISAGRPFAMRHSCDLPDISLPVIDVKRKTSPSILSFLVNAGATASIARNNSYYEADALCPFVMKGALCVNWKGEISPCPALMHSHTCFINRRQKNIRSYHVGDINTDDISKIWIKPEFVDFRRKVIEFDFPPCVTCECYLAESNEEDCFGNAFPTCGDCLWARGVALCP